MSNIRMAHVKRTVTLDVFNDGSTFVTYHSHINITLLSISVNYLESLCLDETNKVGHIVVIYNFSFEIQLHRNY